MLDCLILGDSIAVGVAQARLACAATAQPGITSAAFLQSLFPVVPKEAAHVVISLGVNDPPSMATLDNLRRLRRGIAARRVTWLLPGLKEPIRQQVRAAAAEHGDGVIDTAGQAGPDHLHPSRDGYRRIAAWTEQPALLPASVPAAAAPRTPAPLPPAPGTIYAALSPAPFAAMPPPVQFRPGTQSLGRPGSLPLPARLSPPPR